MARWFRCSRSRPLLLVLGLAAVWGSLGLTGCGGGGGGGGGGPEGGPADWGVPATATSATQSLVLTLHNLTASDATVTLTPYAYDGTPGGVTVVTLDGFDSETLDFAGTPTVAWWLVSTPTRTVEVAFAHTDLTGPVDEASRAFPLDDLGAPPPVTTTSVPVVLDATTLRVTNATAAAVVVTATGYPSPVPGTDAVSAGSVLLPLDPFETTLLDPDTFSVGFTGQVGFSAPTPFFTAVVEGTNDLAFDGVPPVTRRDRTLHADVTFGLDRAVFGGYVDFAVVLTNTSAEPRSVQVSQIRRFDGTAILLAPRSLSLGGHETRAVGTMDAPLADLFGDATLASYLTSARLEFFVPEDVDVSVRRFEPQFLIHLGTTRPQPAGHVVDVLQVWTLPTLTGAFRQWVTVHNPTGVEITVNVGVVVPQPDGFESASTPLTTVTVAPYGFFEFSPDGVDFFDRDGFAVDDVALRLTSATSFAATGRRETRAFNGQLTRWSPLVTRTHDDAN